MTLQEVQKLTDDELRVMVAELCGWKHRKATMDDPMCRSGMSLPNHFGPAVEAWWHPEKEGVFVSPPNFIGDLNAMHSAALSQPESVRKAMRYHLYQMCGQMGAHDATARQRAEAFVLTMYASQHKSSQGSAL